MQALNINIDLSDYIFVMPVSIGILTFNVYKHNNDKYFIYTDTSDNTKIFVFCTAEFIYSTKNCTYSLPIKRKLTEGTRKEGILCEQTLRSLHITKHNEVIITDNVDFTKIYQICTFDYYKYICNAAE